MAEYIEREALADYLNTPFTMSMGFLSEDVCNGANEAREIMMHILSEIPAADVRPVVRGKWVYDEEYCELSGEDSVKCSICGDEFILDEWGMDDFTNMMHYCPNCGADLR